MTARETFAVYDHHIRELVAEIDRLKDDRARLRDEIGDLFGKVGGVTASTPREAWMVLDAMTGRALAAEEQIDRLKSREQRTREALEEIKRLTQDRFMRVHQLAFDALAALRQEPPDAT